MEIILIEASKQILEFNTVFSGQRVLEEFEQNLKEEEQRRDEASDKLERASNVLVGVKAGVEHLADKLLHLKIVSGTFLLSKSVVKFFIKLNMR